MELKFPIVLYLETKCPPFPYIEMKVLLLYMELICSSVLYD
jgi:hypothetical protein